MSNLGKEIDFSANFRIGIRFCDNDFWYTMCGVLDSIENSFAFGRGQYSPGLSDWTKANWAELINSLMPAMYILWQNQRNYSNGQTMEEHFNTIGKYLQIKESDIYLGDEVDTFLSENTWYNSEFFFIDRRLPKDQRIQSR